jgi:hypothetical protein
MKPIIDFQQSYTFSKYFEMKIEAKDLAREFGYSFSRKYLSLPQFQGELDRIEQTKDRILEILPYASLSSEAARREILISPVINEQQTEIIGAVTTGKVWEFAKLNRLKKNIEQGLESYLVPEGLEPLMRILVQV